MQLTSKYRDKIINIVEKYLAVDLSKDSELECPQLFRSTLEACLLYAQLQCFRSELNTATRQKCNQIAASAYFQKLHYKLSLTRSGNPYETGFQDD